ncbi:MAG: glycosyltransferase [Steroidobacteraceae bacterium]
MTPQINCNGCPTVLVLLACYNGGAWIRSQLESILAQQEVDVRVAIRDDGSSDATLTEIAHFGGDDRVRMASSSARTGSAAQNFLRLIRDHPADGFEFVALADQDDIWSHDKLARACRKLSESQSAGYSSATIAAWPNGRTAVLRQADVMTAGDFLLEGAGQGCTFVLRADLYRQVRQFVTAHQSLTGALHYHDWMIYALARSWGHSWTFDPSPSVTYRQHAGNDTGARTSVAGIRKRLARMRRGWYRAQLTAICAVCAAAGPYNVVVAEWNSLLLANSGWRRKLRMMLFCLRGGRRRVLDNLIVVFAALAGWI